MVPKVFVFRGAARLAKWVFLAWFTATFVASAAPGWAGDLSALRDAVREDEPSRESRTKHGEHYHPDSCDDDPWMSFRGECAFWVIASPYWGPRAVLEGDFSGVRYFGRAPYSDVAGYMTRIPPKTGNSYFWSGRMTLDYVTDFDDLTRVGGQLLFSTATRFDIDTTAVRWREELSAAGRDELWIGDFNVVYRFAQSDHVQFRSGLGFNWLDDAADTDFGFNFTYGADIFPCRPWVITAALDWGRLGHAELFHGTVTLGAVWGPVEVFTGYDYYNVGDTEINGLVGGLRFWF